MKDDNQELVVSVGELKKIVREAKMSPFMLGDHFNSDNIVEVAKSQFPRLEAKVAIHRELERTKRLLIGVAGFCLIAGAALIVFAPQGKEGVSYVVAAALLILSLGAIGVQEFRIRTVGVKIDGGEKAVQQNETN